MNVDPWVDDSLASLDVPHDWLPDADRAFARLREKNRVHRIRRRRWTWIAVASSVIGLSVLAMPGRCDSPQAPSCGRPLALLVWDGLFPRQIPAISVPRQSSELKTATASFKEVGSPHAPVTCEVFTDYECPPCATLYRQIIPLLIDQYVRTGKVRLVYRDFPLTHHPYARLAARYVNAAGRLGQYDLAVNAIFRTQSLWSANGGVDQQLSQVLPPRIIEKVRELVEHDRSLDDEIAADMAKATAEGIHQTPTMVVSKSKRQVIPGVPDFRLLKSYLDNLLRNS